MKRFIFLLAVLLVLPLTLYASTVYAHCEMPCGIYDDHARISMIKEDADTIEKSMMKIEQLALDKEKNYNQIVRWVNNKEEHAGKIQNIISRYFMTQRIKPIFKDKAPKAYEKYTKELALLHQMLIYAMKAKQSTDTSYVTALRAALTEFENSYFNITSKPQIPKNKGSKK